jgi:hypothetical protein
MPTSDLGSLGEQPESTSNRTKALESRVILFTVLSLEVKGSQIG